MRFPRLLFIVLALVLSLFWFRGVHVSVARANSSTPKTIKAASCNTSDVERALQQANNGDTVYIPAGICHWTIGIRYTLVGSLTIMGAGDQSLGGGDKTVIVDDINRPDDPPLLLINTAVGQTFRLTGTTIRGGDMRITSNGAVRISGNSKAVRVDHSHFDHIRNQSLTFSGWEYGVVDHNLFDYHKTQVTVRHGNWNGETDGWGDQSWADSSYFGSEKFIFIEDNVFNGSATLRGGGAADDCDHGGRLVFRYNTLHDANFQVHEMEGRGQGCRAYEVYNNMVDSPNVENSFAYLRTGTGLLWGNTTTGVKLFVTGHNDRSETINANFPPPPRSWGKCGKLLGPSIWDGNTDSTGYPCFNQLGRGKGDLLRNPFPVAANSVTRNVLWPREALEPIYVWGNSYNPLPNESANALWATWPEERGVIVENRDYYLQLPNYNEPHAVFNGSAGVGQGILSKRPATCTPLVAYWATDTNTLYQCSAKDTWTVYYTPYTYPHPLQKSSSVTSPVAPPNIKVTRIH
jgi:hypothetical protein